MRSPVFLAILVCTTLSATALEPTLYEYRSDDTLLTMAPYRFEKGRTIALSVGIGSGAFHHPDDPPRVMWTVGDRGPNLGCSEMKAVAHVELAACREAKNARIFLTPGYTPSIYRVLLDTDAGRFRITDVIVLKDRDGRPLNGLPTPRADGRSESALDARGRPLAPDVHGVDPEGIVRLTDGTFWIAEENGPSLLHVSAEGRTMTRYVPQGSESDYAGARYDVVGALPAILSRRQPNRGFEAIAISPDERFLYVMMQSPLANPDVAAFRNSRHVRLLRIERTSMQLTGEYVYVLDDPASFRRDPSAQAFDARVSEMTAIGPGRLLVLERTEMTTKIYRIDLSQATDIRGSQWDDAATQPSLETVDLHAAAIIPVGKTPIFDSADHPVLAGKTEAMALLGDGDLVLISDDDFGVHGKRTQVMTLRGLVLDAR